MRKNLISTFLLPYFFISSCLAMQDLIIPSDSHIDKSPKAFKKQSGIKQESSLINILFNKESENIWVLKNRGAFLSASNFFISDEGEWLGEEECPKVIKYSNNFDKFGSIQKEDLKVVEKWLKLKPLEFFSITENSKNASFGLVYEWYEEKKENRSNLQDSEIHKLIWLGPQSTRHQKEFLGLTAFPPEDWIQSHVYYHLAANTL